MSAPASPGSEMGESPARSWDEQKEALRSERENYGRRSSDLDLNQVASRLDDAEGDDYESNAKGEQWPEEGEEDMDVGHQQQLSPLPEASKRSPSPRSPSPDTKRSPLPFRQASVSPDQRRSGSYSDRRSPSPERRRPSPGRRGSPSPSVEGSLSPRKRNTPPGDARKRRYDPDRSLSRSPTGRLGRAVSPHGRERSPVRRGSPSPSRERSLSPRRRGTPPGDGGRRRHDHDRSLSRSPTGRSGRAVSPHGRERERYGRSRTRSPPPRDYRRSPRSRYSPRGRYSSRRRPSPPRYRSRRSPRRRPWSPPPNRSTGFGKPGNNLFIAGFGFITTERDLEKKFSRFGRVTDVRIVRDKRSGDSRGFGFLTLERDEDADAAIKALDQTEWNGRVVLVEKAKTPTRY